MTGDDIKPGDTVFLLSPINGEREDTLCGDLLDQGDPGETAVLFVTLTDTPADRLGFWEEYVGEHPARTSVVHTSEAGASADVGDSVEDWVVRNPGNLTQLGVRITEALDEMRSESANIVVCFRSLSALLQYASTSQAFQFMQILTDQFKQADAMVHVHMNTDAHDDQTVATFAQVFDRVIQTQEDGAETATR